MVRVRVGARIRVRVGVRVRVKGLAICTVSALRDLGVVLARARAELLARVELLARNDLRGGVLRDVTGGRVLAGLLEPQATGLVSRQQAG
eukprot:scaffold14091_cov52-Phaeocystis_antarctica.AAC.1